MPLQSSGAQNTDTNYAALEKLFSMTYEDAQKFAQELKASGDQPSIEMAEFIETLAPDFFQTTKAQEALKNLLQYLMSQNFSRHKILEVFDSVIKASGQQTFADIEKMMNPEVKASWDELNRHQPNFLQQVTLLNHLCEELGMTTFDELYEKNLEMVVQEILAAVEKEVQFAQKVSNLPEEYVKEINKYFDEGNYERAVLLIYQYNQHVTSGTSSSQGTV